MRQEIGNIGRSTRRHLQLDRGKVEKAARAGYVAKGVVYGMVGLIALQAAYYGGASTEGSQGVLVRIARQPFGTVLLSLVLLGLLGYSFWRFYQGITDVEGHGWDAKGLVKRSGYGISGLVHLGLALWGTGFLIGTAHASSGDGSSQQEWTARLMGYPFGRWFVALVGAVVVGVGIHQMRRGITGKFLRDYDLGAMREGARKTASWSGRAGLCARGVVFVLIGTFLVQAAVRFDPSEARGLRGTLDTLARQPYGPWLLGLVALGLVAYGLYCFTRARYRSFAAQH